MENLFSVKEKRIVITGAGGVLCGRLAVMLAKLGALVAILDLDLDAAKAVADEITAQGGTAFAIQCNVLDEMSVAAARDQVMAQLGGVDVLINGAGGNKKMATTGPERSLFDLEISAIRECMDLNVMGCVIPSIAFAKIMIEQGHGNILMFSSMNAFTPLTRILAYSAAKAAVSNVTQWLATHMAQEYTPNIRVNALAPGFFLTKQNWFLLIAEDESAGGPRDVPLSELRLTKRGQQILDHTPMGRFGRPEDLLGPTLLLISDAGGFMTGVILQVDGGYQSFSGV